MFTGPNIVEEGLILALDAANTKSYPGSGTAWYDLSGNGYDGTLHNGPVFSSNKITTDGVNDLISVPDDGSLAITPTDSFTVEAVFALNSLAFRADGYDSACAVFGRGSTSGAHGIGCNQYHSSGQLSLRMGTRASSQVVEAINIDNDRIYHGTFTYTPTIQIAYLDSVQFGTGDTSGGAGGTFDQNNWVFLDDNAVPGGNGGRVSGSIFLGRIYNRALTASEVLQNYNATKARFGL